MEMLITILLVLLLGPFVFGLGLAFAQLVWITALALYTLLPGIVRTKTFGLILFGLCVGAAVAIGKS